MDRGCIYQFLFHSESFLGTTAANMWSDKDSESVKYF